MNEAGIGVCGQRFGDLDNVVVESVDVVLTNGGQSATIRGRPGWDWIRDATDASLAV